ncbi:transmembrane protein 14C-like isoform X1 [Carettochelys insculpta]|uniref:transmembrane protein 14C-like isoform X1 n=1 Tax=Carettochelys insculpta TaxID=44489 RepID=UPI003EBCFB4E
MGVATSPRPPVHVRRGRETPEPALIGWLGLPRPLSREGSEVEGRGSPKFRGGARGEGLRASSVPSLAAGLLFGSLAGLGAYQLSQNPKNVWLSLIASGTLTGVMGMRFYNSGKVMPAGLIAGASLLMVGRLGLKMIEKPHGP